MNDKKMFVQLLVITLLAIPLVAYFSINIEAQGLGEEQAACLTEKSNQLLTQYRQQSAPPPALYYPSPEISASDRIFTSEVRDQYNISVVTTVEALMQRAAQSPRPTAIYLHHDVLDRIDTEWLQQQYEAGIAVAGFDIFVGELGAKLNVDAEGEFLTPDEAVGQSVFTFFFEDSMEGNHRQVVFSEYMKALSSERIPSIVNKATNKYTLSDEYYDAVAKECLE